jgi:transposase-like protein
MSKMNCRDCAGKMQKWGRSRQGRPRFYCKSCKKTATPQRDDIKRRQNLKDIRQWLTNKDSLSQIASEAKVTRQALWKRFHKMMDTAGKEPLLPSGIHTKILVVDGTYIHGHTLCALIAIDENDKIY